MPVAYSYDLKKIALEMLKKGHFREDVCESLEISIATLYLWERQAKKGILKPKQPTGGRKSKINDLEKFKCFVEENPGKTLKELAKLWDGEVSLMAVQRAMKKINYTYKKKLWITKKETKRSEKSI